MTIYMTEGRRSSLQARRASDSLTTYLSSYCYMYVLILTAIYVSPYPEGLVCEARL